MATVTLDMAEYDRLRRQVEQLQLEINQSKNSEPQLPPDIDGLAKTIKAGREVVRFAIANLHPENTKDWPHKALTTFAKGYLKIPGRDENDRDWSKDTIRFAQEAADWQKQREAR